MRDGLDTVMAFGFIATAVITLLFSGYLFYFAPCRTVAQYWMVTHTPARCIAIVQ